MVRLIRHDRQLHRLQDHRSDFFGTDNIRKLLVGITKVIHHNFDAFRVVALRDIFHEVVSFAAFVMEIGIVKERIVD